MARGSAGRTRGRGRWSARPGWGWARCGASARAWRSAEGPGLARFNAKRDLGEDVPLRAGVVEGDVLKLDQSAGVPQRASVGPVEHRGLFVLKLGDPLSRRRGRIHRGAEPSQTANGTVEASEVGEKDEQLTQGDPPLREHPSAC